MKQLKCEMCGSTDIVKQNGVFVCQACGCKYSVEEAKKMMIEGTVEVTGTVKVDNTDAIKNYIDMAKNAINAKNMAEAESYCNRIIEIDGSNWEAWYLKGKAAGWQSTLANVRTGETVNAFINALNNCPKEKKDDLSQSCKKDFEDIQTALLTARVNTFKTHPSKNDLDGLSNDIKGITAYSLTLITKAGVPVDFAGNTKYINTLNIGLCSAWDNIINNLVRTVREYVNKRMLPPEHIYNQYKSENDIIISAFKFTLALCGEKDDNIEVNKLKIKIYKNMCNDYNLTEEAFDTLQKCSMLDIYIYSMHMEVREWNSKISHLESINKHLQDMEEVAKQKEAEAKRKAEIEEQQKRKDAYWAEHTEEKAALDAEKAKLQRKISPLNARVTELDKIKNEPVAKSEKEERAKLRDKMDALNDEYKHLGLFSGKRKKEIQAQLSEMESKAGEIEKVIAAKSAEHDAKIKAETDTLREQMKPLYARMAEIDAELVKER